MRNRSTGENLNTLAIASYAWPWMPVVFLATSIHVVQGVYGTYFNLSLTAISSVMLIAGLFDTITDPIIGYLSDRHRARIGSRKPFVVLGMVSMVPCAWFLFVPVTRADGTVSLGYFIAWHMAFYLAYTFVKIPHYAWGGELSSRSDERSRTFGQRGVAGFCGQLLFFVLPLLPFFESGKITPHTLQWTVLVTGALLLPGLYTLWRHAPVGVPVYEVDSQREHPFRAIRALFANPLFARYLVAIVCEVVANGFIFGLTFLFVDALLGLGQHYAPIMIVHMVTATLLVKPAVGWVNRHEKKRVWVLAALAYVPCTLLWLSALWLDDPTYVLVALYSAQALFGAAVAVLTVVVPSLLTDIVDYGTLRSGRDRSATYFAVKAFLEKAGKMTMGPPLAVAIVGWCGFDPAEPVRSDAVVGGFILAMGIIPTVLSMVMAYLILRVPMNSRRRRLVRRRLDRIAMNNHPSLSGVSR